MPEGEDVLMMRPSTSSPALAGSRKWLAAKWVGAKVPLRWTLMTASHSASVMLTSMRSRRMPALLTRTSSLPNASIAVPTSFSAPAQSLISSGLATACPPAGAAHRAAEVVDPHAGALRRQQQRVLAADAAARAGHDRNPTVTDAHAVSPPALVRA